MKKQITYSQWFIEFGILWGFAVTLLRGLRRPNDWAEAHWLINYEFGLLKRALPGSLMKPLILWGNGSNAETTISVISFVLMGLFCLVLLGMLHTILWRNQFSTKVVWVTAVFVTSPFVVMSGHLNGYFDHQIIILSCLAVYWVVNGRFWAAAIVLTIGLFIHENIFVIGYPCVLWAALLTTNHSTQSKKQTVRKVLPLLLPMAVFGFLFWYQSFAFDALALEQMLTEHLKKFAFIQYDQEVIVPRSYAKSFVAHLQSQSPRFWGRLSNPLMVWLILPNLWMLLLAVRQTLAGWQPLKSLQLIGFLIPFLPLGLHLIAWDTIRIWTYPLLVAWMILWTVCQMTPPAQINPKGSLFLSVGCALVVVVNLFIQIPLMDWRVERFSADLRLLLYLPLFWGIAVALVRNFRLNRQQTAVY